MHTAGLPAISGKRRLYPYRGGRSATRHSDSYVSNEGDKDLAISPPIRSRCIPGNQQPASREITIVRDCAAQRGAPTAAFLGSEERLATPPDEAADCTDGEPGSRFCLPLSNQLPTHAEAASQ